MNMEEKKKRWRPSLTAYREMEETVHRQCVELDAWREKFRELKKEYDKVVADRDNLSDVVTRQKQQMESNGVVTVEEYGELVSRNKALLNSNDKKETELRLLRDKISSYESSVESLEGELDSLRSRGFFARLFNRQ